MLHIQRIPVTPFQQNCSIVCCMHTGECVIIDAGGDLDKIQSYLNKLSQHSQLQAPLQIKAIVLTHAHLDHCGEAPILAKKLNIPIWGPHEADSFWLDLLPQHSASYHSYGFSTLPSFRPNTWLSEGDVIAVGNYQLQVIHTPGHTPGHIVLFEPTLKKAWVGDVIFKGGVGRTDFPKGDWSQLHHSITQKLFNLGDDVEFICGHGDNSTFGHERLHNPYLQA